MPGEERARRLEQDLHLGEGMLHLGIVLAPPGPYRLARPFDPACCDPEGDGTERGDVERPDGEPDRGVEMSDGVGVERLSSGTRTPSRTRSFDWVARIPSVSHVRTISTPGASIGMPLKNVICGPSDGWSSFATVVKCVATSDSVKNTFFPSSRKPPSTRVAVDAQSSIAPP